MTERSHVLEVDCLSIAFGGVRVPTDATFSTSPVLVLVSVDLARTAGVLLDVWRCDSSSSLR